MKNNLIFKGLCALLLMFAFQASIEAAPDCKGQKKNDPGCNDPVAPAAVPAAVDSVTVDWLNQVLVVRGSGFTGSTSFLLGSSVTPLATANVTDAQLDIPFAQIGGELAVEVTSQGNYNLEVDGSVQLSVYIESQIIDPAATGCPCEAEWMAAPEVMWSTPTPTPSADCYEITGPGSNDVADISGTIHSDYPANIVYPQHPIGASYYPGDPESSVCMLVQVNDDASVDTLVSHRINEIQQAECAAALAFYVCAEVTSLP